jgi:predicted Fe-S protein YdhL (DUF1289 family)
MMKQRPATRAAASATQTRPSKGLPCWEKLSSKERQAIMIALTTMMVKRLSDRGRGKERDDE